MYLPISWILVLLVGFSNGYYLRYLPKTHQLFSKSESFQKHIDDAMNLLNGTTAEPATLYRIAFALAQNEAELNKMEEMFNLNYTFKKREAEAKVAIDILRSHYLKKLSFISQRYDD